MAGWRVHHQRPSMYANSSVQQIFLLLSWNLDGGSLPNSDVLPSVLYKINENKVILEAVILKLLDWVEACGSADVAENISGALVTIDEN